MVLAVSMSTACKILACSAKLSHSSLQLSKTLQSCVNQKLDTQQPVSWASASQCALHSSHEMPEAYRPALQCLSLL